MFVFHFLVLRSHQQSVLIFFFSGRDYDYQTLNLTFAVNVIKFGMIIGMFPRPLKPFVLLYSCQDPYSLFTEAHFSIVSRMLSNLPSQIRQQIEFIRPIVEERFAKMEEYGKDWDDKPVRRTIVSECVISYYTDATQNDMLMWFMSEAKGVERSVEGVARRLLLVNFAAIHSTSLASHDLQSPVMWSYSWGHRRSRSFCTVFWPILGVLNLSAKRSAP